MIYSFLKYSKIQSHTTGREMLNIISTLKMLLKVRDWH